MIRHKTTSTCSSALWRLDQVVVWLQGLEYGSIGVGEAAESASFASERLAEFPASAAGLDDRVHVTAQQEAELLAVVVQLLVWNCPAVQIRGPRRDLGARASGQHLVTLAGHASS